MHDPAKKICPSGLLKSIAQETAFFEAVFTFLIPLPGLLFIINFFQTKGFITKVEYLNITSLRLFYSSLPEFTINFRCVRSPPMQSTRNQFFYSFEFQKLTPISERKIAHQKRLNYYVNPLTKAYEYKKDFIGGGEFWTEGYYIGTVINQLMEKGSLLADP